MEWVTPGLLMDNPRLISNCSMIKLFFIKCVDQHVFFFTPSAKTLIA